MPELIMLFVLHALDKSDGLSRRLAAYAAHKAFLTDTSAFGLTIVMSGPLTEDDGTTMKGSFFLIEAPTRVHVERFNEADPFKTADVWAGVSITAFSRRVG
jgi:uncharacterized protein